MALACDRETCRQFACQIGWPDAIALLFISLRPRWGVYVEAGVPTDRDR
jgi:hypothetical protein